jgi:hypothetical protein
MISVESDYFGEAFEGFIPDGFGLKGKDAVAQFLAIAKTWDYSRMDFVCEVAKNRKAVHLNILLLSQFDFKTLGIEHQQRDAIIEKATGHLGFQPHLRAPARLPTIVDLTSPYYFLSVFGSGHGPDNLKAFS